MTKPSIVFAHGLWADGSCFGKLIPTLQAEGYEVMASQHGLDSLATDIAAVKKCLGRVGSPAIRLSLCASSPSQSTSWLRVASSAVTFRSAHAAV